MRITHIHTHNKREGVTWAKLIGSSQDKFSLTVYSGGIVLNHGCRLGHPGRFSDHNQYPDLRSLKSGSLGAGLGIFRYLPRPL